MAFRQIRQDDPANPRRYLDFEEQEDFEMMLNGLATASILIRNEKAHDFIRDMATRWQKFGQTMVVSKKQWDWLCALWTDAGRPRHS